MDTQQGTENRSRKPIDISTKNMEATAGITCSKEDTTDKCASKTSTPKDEKENQETETKESRAADEVPGHAQTGNKIDNEDKTEEEIALLKEANGADEQVGKQQGEPSNPTVDIKKSYVSIDMQSLEKNNSADNGDNTIKSIGKY